LQYFRYTTGALAAALERTVRLAEAANDRRQDAGSAGSRQIDGFFFCEHESLESTPEEVNKALLMVGWSTRFQKLAPQVFIHGKLNRQI
jgi:hypothetical protein